MGKIYTVKIFINIGRVVIKTQNVNVFRIMRKLGVFYWNCFQIFMKANLN